MSDWKYFVSGWTGASTDWIQIESGSTFGSWKLPNPIEPTITVPEKSTRIEVKLANGDVAHLTPEVSTYKGDIPITWQFQSGPTLMISTLKRIKSEDRFFKIITDVPGEEWVGKIAEVNYNKISGWGEHDYRDVIVKVTQIDEA